MKFRIALIAPALALAATPALAQDKEVRIGFINTFSGGAAIYGKHQKDAVELALEHLGHKIGGLDVKMIYGDDQRKPDVGRQQADKMLKKDKVHLVTGIIWSNILAAVQKRVIRSKKILISTNAGWSAMAGKNCSPYFFSTSWNNDQTPEAMGELMNQEKLDNVFLISANYQAGKDIADRLSSGPTRARSRGRILYRLGQRDYQAEISQIRAVKPSALFGFVAGRDGDRLPEAGTAPPGCTRRFRSTRCSRSTYLSLPGHGKAAIGTYHTSYWNNNSDNPVNKRFIADFMKKYGYHPSLFSAQAYDMPFLVDSGVKGAKGDPNDVRAMVAAMEKGGFPVRSGQVRLQHQPHPDPELLPPGGPGRRQWRSCDRHHRHGLREPQGFLLQAVQDEVVVAGCGTGGARPRPSLRAVGPALPTGLTRASHDLAFARRADAERLPVRRLPVPCVRRADARARHHERRQPGARPRCSCWAPITRRRSLPGAAASCSRSSSWWPLALISGIVIELVVLRTMYERDHMDQVLATFGLILFFNESVRLVWGPESKLMPVPGFLDGSVEILPDTPYPLIRLAIILVGLAVGAGLYLLITRTRIGMLIRAGASNRAMVAALGVNIRFLYTLVFGLGAILAGLAGMMAGPIQSVEPGMGEDMLILAFVVIVIGGIGLDPGRGHRLGADRYRRGGRALDPALRAGQLHGRGRGADRGSRGRLDADLRADGGGPVLQAGRAVPRLSRGDAMLTRTKLIVLIAGIVICALLPPVAGATGEDFYISLFARIMIFAIAAVSLDLILGFGGMISFGHAAYLGLGAYSVGIFSFYGINDGFLQFAVAIAGSALVALIIGAICLRDARHLLHHDHAGADPDALFPRHQPGRVWRRRWAQHRPQRVLRLVRPLRGGQSLLPDPDLPDPLRVHHAPGHQLALRHGGARLPRERGDRMQAIGFPTFRYKLTAFVISGTMCGIAGALLANLTEFVTPEFNALVPLRRDHDHGAGGRHGLAVRTRLRGGHLPPVRGMGARPDGGRRDRHRRELALHLRPAAGHPRPVRQAGGCGG